MKSVTRFARSRSSECGAGSVCVAAKAISRIATSAAAPSPNRWRTAYFRRRYVAGGRARDDGFVAQVPLNVGGEPEAVA
jgi:hypothetical protein